MMIRHFSSEQHNIDITQQNSIQRQPTIVSTVRDVNNMFFVTRFLSF